MKKFIIAISCILMTVTPVSLTYADSHKGPDYDYDFVPEPKQEQKKVPNLKGRNPFEWQKILPTDYPKVEYPTAMIGQFMNFCGTIMMQRFQYENVQPQIAQASSGFVCSCIMDSYRENNAQAEFQFEFTRATAKDVPLFTEYLNKCSTMNAQTLSLFKRPNQQTSF